MAGCTLTWSRAGSESSSVWPGSACSSASASASESEKFALTPLLTNWIDKGVALLLLVLLAIEQFLTPLIRSSQFRTHSP